ncbi:hypothetical protein HYALB_00014035 [Hymenoscyphus albidus]|uniref:Uncharacterized protein n=1 Tax=Hymenoscyphus albidus TaxID=595503 RepID=A0A9N9M1M2_9HELO|nr:hypothetical protein HYALB_00014035 [Hymenoscyphus albidus]
MPPAGRQLSTLHHCPRKGAKGAGSCRNAKSVNGDPYCSAHCHNYQDVWKAHLEQKAKREAQKKANDEAKKKAEEEKKKKKGKR